MSNEKPEPFGYFKAEPFGWRDCAETDEGAIALYEAPQPQADCLRETAELKRLSACCPELNMNNYGHDDVDELNSWAIEVSQYIDRAICQPQADALDTERLDWLIEQGCSHGVVYEGLDKSFWMVWLDGHDAHKDKHQISRYHTAREAIDAAKGFPAAKESK